MATPALAWVYFSYLLGRAWTVILTAVAIALQRWPIVGRRSELEVFEQALASDERAGLVIYGRAGVGKTRLADECAAQAAAIGFPTERVVGSRTTSLLPLGAVAGLLAGGLGRPGPDGQVHMVTLFEETRRALARRHEGRRLITVADDVSQFDDVSLALLGYLADQKTIFLIATVRTGEPVPDLVTSMWRDNRLERIDLADLSRMHFDTLLHLALGGPMEAGAGREIWEITGGNPLYARELVLGALESGALVERSQVWHLDDRLPPTGRLQDLVEQRIGSLSEQARSVVELLALCQPVELSYLDTVAPPDVIEPLEQAGLVTIDVGEGEARLAHPLHAKVVRDAMPRLRTRSILLAQARRLELAEGAGGAGGRPPAGQRASDHAGGPTALRIATWRLDAGVRPDPAILVRGAQLARDAHDFRVVRRLLEAVPGDQLDGLGALLLGEALYELGAFDQAENVLAGGQLLPQDQHSGGNRGVVPPDQHSGGNRGVVPPDQHSENIALRLAVIRVKNANWGLCDPDKALAINAAARAAVTSQPLIEELDADEASVLMFSGQPDKALAVLGRIGRGDRRTSVVRAIVAAPALAVNGRTTEAVKVAEAGFAEHTALGDELAIAHPATHVVNQVFALTEAGRLAEAEQLARLGAEVVASHRVPIAQIWFAANLGRIAILQGRPVTAKRYCAEAAGLAEVNRFAGPQRLPLSGLALAHAMLGDAEAAAATLAERAALPEFGFLAPEQMLADAWTASASNQPTEAAELFRQAAAQAAATGHLTTESWLLHDLMRTCRQDVSARLSELAELCDSPLVAARARHAAAVRARDPAELERAADDFESLGAMLLAAEAATNSGEAFSQKGDQRRATAASRRSSELGERCENAATPGLVRTGSAVPLSGREREIAMLAAAGLASKDIAERLFLSVRTVNNHLQHVYTKLGVSSRADLAEALGGSS